MMIERDPRLVEAIEEAGGPAAVGKVIGISSQAVSQWTRCPAERAITLANLTGGKVTRHQLRPDIYPAEYGAPSQTPDPERAPTPSEAA